MEAVEVEEDEVLEVLEVKLEDVEAQGLPKKKD